MLKKLLVASALLAATVGVCVAEEMNPQQMMPQPTAQHAWLQQFVGEWESTNQMVMEPGKEPVVTTGTESVRPLGQFWTVSEVKSTMMGSPFTGNFTLGYDEKKNKFVGTWVDSMTGKLWEYEGTMDASGKKLTLESEGECPMRPGKTTKFRETLEVVSPDHKVFRSAMLDDNGQWVTMMTSESRRKE